jgi:UDP-N-acetylglucosamine--N-acetylmuramyl-(pentapeptide) pyrophosphoryl-undecaprenol N-acetylglucosamine transferase
VAEPAVISIQLWLLPKLLEKHDPKIQIDFVGTSTGLETKIVPRENFPLHLINVGALNSVNFFTKILTLFLLPVAVVQAGLLLLKLRPRFVLGVGGYASGPVMLAAVILKPFLKTKLALFEANAMPGLTNRWLAQNTQVAFTNFEASNKYFKTPLTVGMPIRTGLSFSEDKPRRSSNTKLHVLIFGGSQGARGINLTVSEAVKNGGSWLDNIEVVHQIGSTDFKRFDELYKSIQPKQVKWFEFLYDMPERYKWADLVICRAGASTLAELAACHKAAVLVPFPFASDNHQQENADAIAKENGAIVILQKDFTPEKLAQLVEGFKNQPDKLSQYENGIGQFFKARSAERVAEMLIGESF